MNKKTFYGGLFTSEEVAARKADDLLRANAKSVKAFQKINFPTMFEAAHKQKKYFGVQKSGKKWRVERMLKRKKHVGGTYESHEEAARASDRLWRELGGSTTKLNFPAETRA